MIKYRTRSFDNHIKKIECVKETKHFVFIDCNGRNGKPIQDSKKSSFTNYYDSFQEAKDAIVNRKLKEIESLESRLSSAHRELEEAQQLKEAVDE